MPRFDRLAVAVDFSPYSKTVFKQSVLCARLWKSKKIDVIHVVPFVPHLFAASDAKKVTERYIADILRKLKVQYSGGPGITYHVKVGVPYEEILKVARNASSQIIFIGHKGKSALERVFLGTTAERVALRAKVPVWVHRGTSVKKPSRILVPFDFSPSSMRAYNFAAGMPGVSKNKISVLHSAQSAVVPLLDYPSWEYLEAAHQRWQKRSRVKLKKQFPRSKTIVADGYPPDVILKKLRQFDLAIMATHGGGKILGSLGSVTARVLRASPVPVLVTR